MHTVEMFTRQNRMQLAALPSPPHSKASIDAAKLLNVSSFPGPSRVVMLKCAATTPSALCQLGPSLPKKGQAGRLCASAPRDRPFWWLRHLVALKGCGSLELQEAADLLCPLQLLEESVKAPTAGPAAAVYPGSDPGVPCLQLKQFSLSSNQNMEHASMVVNRLVQP
jgi:hypothetical protein